MATASERAAIRRLHTILNDENYGPKLVRLNRGGERRVLELVEQGKGREARKLIDELDAARRAKTTAERKARKERPKEPGPGTTPRIPWEVAAQRMGQIARAVHPEKNYKSEKYVAAAEQHGRLQDWEKFLALRHSEPTMMLDARWDAKTGQSWSVFWYHYW